ncbi:MAG: hypothetical protein O2854_05555 [Chloroflexi bacterium]|nr:hypothetical protein [Chloroflexota bacterium]
MIGILTRNSKLAVASMLAVLIALIGVSTALAAEPAQEAVTQTRGIFGTVTVVSDFSLTVETKEGNAVDIVINADTQFRIANSDSPSLVDIIVGNRIAAVVIDDGGVLTARKLQVISSAPTRVHLTLTVVEVNGTTVVAEDEDGNRVEVTLSVAPGDAIVGQTVKFVGVRSGDSSELRASVQVQIQSIVERLQRHTEKVRGERDEQGTVDNADSEHTHRQQEERLAKLKAQLEENMKRQLNVLAEVIDRLSDEDKARVRVALGNIEENHVRVLQALADTQEEEEQAQARIAARTANGTVARISADDGQLLVTTDRKSELLLTVNANTVIRVGSGRGTLADIQVGDGMRVEYAVRGEVNIALQLHAVTEASAAGNIVRMTDSGSVIVIQTNNNQNLQLNLTRETRIEINGEQGVPADLSLGMNVKVVYQIRTLNATAIGASTIARIEGTLTGIFRDEHVITVASADGNEIKLLITEKTRIHINGRVAALSSLREGARIQGSYNAATSEALVLEVTLVNDNDTPRQQTAFGEVLRNSPATDDLVMRTSEGRELVLHVTVETRIAIGDLPADHNDIKVGDQIRVAYIPASSGSALGNVATHIQVQVHSTVYGTISRIAASAGVVVITNENGRAVELNVTNATEVILNGQVARLSQLRVNMNAKAAYNLRTGEAIALSASSLAEITGTVSAVSTEERTIAVTTEDGRSLRIVITSTTRISVDGRLGNLANLLNNARVHVVYNTVTNEAVSLTVRAATNVRADGTVDVEKIREKATEILNQAEEKKREILDQAKERSQEVLREAEAKLNEIRSDATSAAERARQLREQAANLLEEAATLERNVDRTDANSVADVKRRIEELRLKAAELIRQANELVRQTETNVKDEVKRVVENTTDTRSRVQALIQKAEAVLREAESVRDLTQRENTLREFVRVLLSESSGLTEAQQTQLREVARKLTTRADTIRKKIAEAKAATNRNADGSTGSGGSRSTDSDLNRDGTNTARQNIDALIQKVDVVLREVNNEEELRRYASDILSESERVQRDISTTDVTTRARLVVLRDAVQRLEARANEIKAKRDGTRAGEDNIIDESINEDDLADGVSRIDQLIDRAGAILRDSDNDESLRAFALNTLEEIARVQRGASTTDVTLSARILILRGIVTRIQDRADALRLEREKKETDKGPDTSTTDVDGDGVTDVWTELPSSLRAISFLTHVEPDCLRRGLTSSAGGDATWDVSGVTGLLRVTQAAEGCLLTTVPAPGTVPDAASSAGTSTSLCTIAFTILVNQIAVSQHPSTVRQAISQITTHCTGQEVADINLTS